MFSLPSLLLVVAAATAEKVKLGDIQTFHHAASGELWALDENTLMVKDFNYDGAGPDAFFWVGTMGTVKNPIDESKTAILAHPFKGEHYEYRNQAAPVLGAASNQQATLILPAGMKVSDLKWFSVWCRKFAVDFGSLEFDASALFPSSDLPSPLAPPSNSVEEGEEGAAEPEAEPEAESEPEPGYDHGSNSVAEPESEPSTKGEPEPEPKGAAATLASSLLPLLATLLLARL